MNVYLEIIGKPVYRSEFEAFRLMLISQGFVISPQKNGAEIVFLFIHYDANKKDILHLIRNISTKQDSSIILLGNLHSMSASFEKLTKVYYLPVEHHDLLYLLPAEYRPLKLQPVYCRPFRLRCLMALTKTSRHFHLPVF